MAGELFMGASSIVCIGTAVADHILGDQAWPHDDVLVASTPLAVVSGGGAINSAKVLAKLKNRVAVVAKVGDDWHGRLIRSSLSDAGKTTWLGGKALKDCCTSLGFVCVEKQRSGDLERNILYVPGADAKLNMDDLERCEKQITSAKVVFLSMLGLLPQIAPDDLSAFIKRVKDKNKDIVFASDTVCLDDPKRLPPEQAKKWRQYVLAALEHVDWFLPSLSEAAQLADSANRFEAIRLLQTHAARLVAVKLREEGCMLTTKDVADAAVQVSAIKVRPQSVKDPTGAGDAWCAGFIHAMLKGGIQGRSSHEYSSREALNGLLAHAAGFANATAALNIQRIGGGEGEFDEKMLRRSMMATRTSLLSMQGRASSVWEDGESGDEN